MRRPEVHPGDDQRRAVRRDPVRDRRRAPGEGLGIVGRAGRPDDDRRGTRAPSRRPRTARALPGSLRRVRSSISIGLQRRPTQSVDDRPQVGVHEPGPARRLDPLARVGHDDEETAGLARQPLEPIVRRSRRRRTASEGCIRRGSRRRRRCRSPGRRFGLARAVGAAGAAARAGGPGRGRRCADGRLGARHGTGCRRGPPRDSATDSSASSQPGAHSIALGPDRSGPGRPPGPATAGARAATARGAPGPGTRTTSRRSRSSGSTPDATAQASRQVALSARKSRSARTRAATSRRPTADPSPARGSGVQAVSRTTTRTPSVGSDAGAGWKRRIGPTPGPEASTAMAASIRGRTVPRDARDGGRRDASTYEAMRRSSSSR